MNAAMPAHSAMAAKAAHAGKREDASQSSVTAAVQDWRWEPSGLPLNGS